MTTEQDGGFLSRWSQRKALVREGREAPAGSPPTPPHTPAVEAAPALPLSATEPPPAAAEPPPTLADVDRLDRDADFSRFVANGVEPEVKHAALKKLFSDPHFNVMDGLDTYIDDYNTPDPLPLHMLKQMSQALFLGLVQAEPAPTSPTPDEDTDLRLQPDDVAGRAGAGAGPEQDPGRPC